MGAAGAMLAASRIISQAARTASGSGGTGDVGGTRTDMGSSDGMTTNFTGPIPMTPNGGNAMDINDMTSDGDFDKESPSGPGNQQNEASPADKTVFEELWHGNGKQRYGRDGFRIWRSCKWQHRFYVCYIRNYVWNKCYECER